MKTLVLGGIGAITPAGIGIDMINTSVQAQLCCYRFNDILDSDKPVKLALVPEEALNSAIDLATVEGRFNARERRMLRLATLAMQDLKPHLPEDLTASEEGIAVMMAGPEFHGSAAKVSQQWLWNLGEQSGIAIDFHCSRVCNRGRAGAIELLDMAFRYLEGTGRDYVIVGGVDSFYDMLLLDILSEQSRLLSIESVDGFAAGEGAGFILLMSPTAAQQGGGHIHLQRPVIQDQALPSGSPSSASRGANLASAVGLMTRNMEATVSYLCSSNNGEHEQGSELNMALARHGHVFQEGYTLAQPAQYFGDIGAAFAPVAIGLASVNLHQAKAKAETQSMALVCAASDSPIRGVVGLTRG